MSFVPRTFEQILDDMIAYVKVQTNLTDFEIGANVRTTLEAAALEDDEQYFQMVQLLDAFSLNTASGSDLDERVAQFNIVRLQPAAAAGQVVIQDRTLIRDALLFDELPANLTAQLQSSVNFPTAGYPYTVRVGEGTVQVEDVSVTNNNTGTGVLTLAGPGFVNPHSAGALVAFVSGAADRTIASSVQVQVPSKNGNPPIKVVTIEGGIIVNGNFESTPINAQAVTPGALGNVGASQISAFSAAAPFSGAGVRNVKKFAGGRDLETDQQLRDRARQQIQALSKGTITAIRAAALGVTDLVTGQRVTTANILEDFLNGEVIVYVDDGTGFTPDTVQLARTTLQLNPAPNPGAASLTLVDASRFPQSGYALVSTEDLTQIELVRFTAVNYTTNVMTLAAVTTRTHNLGDEVVLVDAINLAAQPGTSFLQLRNFPVVRGSFRLWIDNGGGFAPLIAITDYEINRGNGEIQLVSGLAAGGRVVATYAYYTGLVKTVQTVVDGAKADPVNFPGVRAGGVRVVVETPIIHRVTVRLSITAQPGFTESSLTSQVREAVEAYISSLAIGDDVIRSEIIQRAMEVTGMYNVVVVSPASDVVILQNELPVPFDSNGTSLVTVT